MRKKINLIGKRFGRLLVLEFSHKNKFGNFHWKVKCDCGKENITCGNSLTRGKTKSCGCLQSEIASKLSKYHYKHGMSGSSIHNTWLSMKQRCLDKKCPAYKNYGGRGIKVCNRWLHSFENFYADMGDRPEGLTLERIDNGKGYYKDNCKWADWITQQNNRRNNHLLTYKGVTLTLIQWAKKLDLSYPMLRVRIYRKWSIERVLSG